MQKNNEIDVAYKYLCQLLHITKVKLSNVSDQDNFYQNEIDIKINDLVEKLNLFHQAEQISKSLDFTEKCCSLINFTTNEIQLISYKISYILLYKIRDAEIATLYPEFTKYNTDNSITILLALEYYVINKAIDNIDTEEKIHMTACLKASYEKCIVFLAKESIDESVSFIFDEHNLMQSHFYRIDDLIYAINEDFRLEFPKVTERINLFRGLISFKKVKSHSYGWLFFYGITPLIINSSSR